MTNPIDILNELEQIRAETLSRLEALTQEQLDWKPLSENEERTPGHWEKFSCILRLTNIICGT